MPIVKKLFAKLTGLVRSRSESLDRRERMTTTYRDKGDQLRFKTLPMKDLGNIDGAEKRRSRLRKFKDE